MTCLACGSPTAEGAVFCSQCGASLVVPGGGPERRVVTALFCDLIDSTGLGERTDPEELDPMLRRYYALAREVVERRGGVIEKFIGDAVAALFGFPLAHEDDPERAVRAAVEIVQGVHAAGLDLAVRVAVETGEAFVRENVAQGHGFATGDVLNTASRLQTAADAMSVVVGPRAAASVVRSFELVALPPLRLKGKQAPVQAWRVVGAVAPGAPAAGVPLFGRERELGDLRSAVRGLTERAGGVVLVEGEPGIGKSRLVWEVRESSGVLWLRGRSIETRDAAGYRPFAEQIRAWAGRPATWDELVWRTLALGLGREHARFLAAIAEIEPDPETAERLARLDPEALGPSVYRSVRAWLGALSASRPLVLEFEDWHWADGASVQLLEHILPLVRDRPLLILGVARSGAVTAGPFAAAGARRLSLSPLAEDEARLLLGELVTDSVAAPDRLRSALARAEGNPYFLHELSRFLTEGGESAELPDSVRAVVISRVDRLPPELRELLRSASVIGRSFGADLLADVSGSHGLAAGLEELSATRLIERVDEGRYAFAHALTREAVYEAVPLAERRRLHREVADALMEDASEAASLPAIAYHLAQAEDWEAAAAALVAAGEHAARLASDDEALQMYRAAIEAHERLPADLWSPRERSRIDREVADTLRRLGRHEEASRQIVAALARLGVRLPEEKGAIKRAALRQLVPRLLGPPALPKPDAIPDPVQLEIDRELEVLGWIAYFEDFDKVALVDLLLANRATRAGDLEGMAVGTFRGALTFLALGRERLAWRYGRRALEAADRLTDPVQVARVKQGIAVVALGLGGWDETRALAEPALELCAEAGELRIWAASAALLLSAAAHHGDLARARELAIEVERAGAEGGNRQIHGWGLGFMSFVRMLEGDAEDAVRYAEASVDELLRVPDHLIAVTGLGGLARAQLRADDIEAATATIEWAHREAESHGFGAVFVAFEIEARTELALLQLSRSRSRAAEAASRRANRDSLRKKHIARWHTVHASVLDGGTAWLLGDERRAGRAFARAQRLASQYEWHGALAEATRWVAHCYSEAGVEPPSLIAVPAEAAAAARSPSS